MVSSLGLPAQSSICSRCCSSFESISLVYYYYYYYATQNHTPFQYLSCFNPHPNLLLMSILLAGGRSAFRETLNTAYGLLCREVWGIWDPTSTTQLAELLHWGYIISNGFSDLYAISLLMTSKFCFLTSLKQSLLLVACLIATWKCKVIFQWTQLLDGTYIEPFIKKWTVTIIAGNCFWVQEQWIMKGRKWKREFPNSWPMARVHLCRRKKCLSVPLFIVFFWIH